jgi:hypothetical protein
MPKKIVKNAKSKKISILQSAIKNVAGKQVVKSAKLTKFKKPVKRVWCFGLIGVFGVLALFGILMFYFKDQNLWANRANVDCSTRQEIKQQLAPVGLANPASEFCAEKGGHWKTWNNSVGEGGVCYFSEFRQCEEWAMYRGDCPVGGADLSKYFDNKAKQYCVMSGGQIVGEEDCTLPNGVTCNLVELLRGICQP